MKFKNIGGCQVKTSFFRDSQWEHYRISSFLIYFKKWKQLHIQHSMLLSFVLHSILEKELLVPFFNSFSLFIKQQQQRLNSDQQYHQPVVISTLWTKKFLLLRGAKWAVERCFMKRKWDKGMLSSQENRWRKEFLKAV